MRKIAILCVLGLLLVAPTVHALSVSELQAQIQSLLTQLASLREQLAQVEKKSDTEMLVKNDDASTVRLPICNRPFTNRLAYGTKGETVADLQGFLKNEGVFLGEATGYFGAQTERALKDWQSQNGVVANGSAETTGYGVAGPRTWDVIGQRCRVLGGGFVAYPSSGNAPLTVTFRAKGLASTWTDPTTGMTHTVMDRGDRYIDFGDGASLQKLSCENSTTAECLVAVTHVYTADGTYRARLLEKGGFAGPNAPDYVVAQLTVQVGSSNPIACPANYAPVCGTPKRCMYEANSVHGECAYGKTYSNRCGLDAEGATFRHEGECKKDTTMCPQYMPPRCESGTLISGGYDGNGCTLPPKCSTDPVGTVSINGFSGPSTLSVGQSGTWSVNASDSQNGQLTYSIDWGDTGFKLSSAVPDAAMSVTQQTTFTHAYATAGTYKVIITVRNALGKTATATATVVVGGGGVACTMEYMPVCGTKTMCTASLACPEGFSGGSCQSSCVSQLREYSNACVMRADGATLVRYGSCYSSEVSGSGTTQLSGSGL
jgi:peptidoglycan hydrolase-like protein with peptidoglycan-binding domain